MNFFKPLVLVLLSLFVFVGCGAPEGNHLKSPSEVAQIIDDQSIEDLQIIDVRTPEEFAEGCLEGARNVDFRASDFLSKFSELDKDGEYLVYCRSGNRSSSAVQQVKAAGYENVIELDGGVVKWDAEGYELSTKC
jgi:rhodanese-related sulfurtransferase